MTTPALSACDGPITSGPLRGLPATGTYAGFRRHKTKGEQPCGACRAARAEYERKYRDHHPERFREAGRRYYYANRAESHDRVRAWRASNPDKYREAALRRNYGMTLPEFNALLESQGGVCAICRKEPPERRGKNKWHIDHDHGCCSQRPTCGRCTRGVLCSNCNQGLGRLGESNLRAAIAYLERR